MNVIYEGNCYFPVSIVKHKPFRTQFVAPLSEFS